jgi:molybdopterin converting factor small subunit
VRIRLKLMGMLKDNAPDDGTLALENKASIRDALVALGIPVESVQVFQVNGQLERDNARELADNDELTVLPPVGGG